MGGAVDGRTRGGWSGRRSRGWHPPPGSPGRRKPDLHPYRSRAGRLTRLDDRSPAGFLCVEIEQTTSKVGGALWRRRWEPWYDTIVGFLLISEEREEFFDMTHEEVRERVRQWPAGRFDRGEEYAIEWLDDAETARFRRDFGFADPSG